MGGTTNRQIDQSTVNELRRLRHMITSAETHAQNGNVEKLVEAMSQADEQFEMLKRRLQAI